MSLDLMPGFGAFTTAVVGGQTWDAAKKSSSLTLSSGDTIITPTANSIWMTALGVTGQSTGKWCIGYEVAAYDGSNPASFIFGIAAAPGGTYDTYLGGYSNSAGAQGLGTDYLNGFTAGVSQSLTIASVGQWVAVYVDLDAGKVWRRDSVNNFQNGQDPATGANPWITFTPGGTYYPGASLYSDTANAIKILSGGAFPTSVPSGFSAW